MNYAENSLKNARVLIVEDSAEIVEILDAFFEEEGAEREIARDGAAAIAAFDRFSPDLVVLDLKLPERDGLSVLAELRGKGVQTPVIIVSALGDDIDRLTGFKLGCDDYVVKPFNPLEVIARAHVCLRRQVEAPSQSSSVILGSLRIDYDARIVICSGSPLDLTPTEFHMLAVLARRAGRLVSRGQLVDAALDEDVFDRSVNPHISRLRQKLLTADAPVQISSVRGEGYRLELQ